MDQTTRNDRPERDDDADGASPGDQERDDVLELTARDVAEDADGGRSDDTEGVDTQADPDSTAETATTSAEQVGTYHTEKAGQQSSGGALVPAGKTSVPSATRSKSRPAQRQMQYLAQSVVLEEAGTSHLVRLAIIATSLVVTIFIVWSMLTDVDEIATALGDVLPSGSVRVVQHLEGGIVKSVLVEEGQMVEEGQPLIRFDGQATRAEYQQMLAREAGLLVRAERLKAFAEGREADFSNIPEQYRHLINDQEQILGQQRRSLGSQRSVLLEQLAQRREELRALQETERSLAGQAAFLSEQVAMREELMQKGLTSRITYLETRREYARIVGERNKVQKQITAAQDAIDEAQGRLRETTDTLEEEALKEMGTVNAELAQVREAKMRLTDRLNRLEVRAPVRGLVQNVRFRTVGAVVPPAGTLMEVVPIDETLWVEARIKPQDIGFVDEGQEVKIKVTAYDFARFGAIPGTLRTISPTTFLDPNGDPYYKGIVELHKTYVGNNPDEKHVLPGMTVQADIVTGQKTVFEYLLRPIYIGMQGSFRER